MQAMKTEAIDVIRVALSAVNIIVLTGILRMLVIMAQNQKVTQDQVRDDAALTAAELKGADRDRLREVRAAASAVKNADESRRQDVSDTADRLLDADSRRQTSDGNGGDAIKVEQAHKQE
jgi:3-phosphoglycerate kinase